MFMRRCDVSFEVPRREEGPGCGIKTKCIQPRNRHSHSPWGRFMSKGHN